MIMLFCEVEIEVEEFEVVVGEIRVYVLGVEV